MDDQRLDELARLERAATPGPWWSPIEARDGGLGGSDVIFTVDDDRQRDPDVYVRISVNGGPSHPVAEADQDFIAAARNAVPELIAEVRALRARLAAGSADEPGRFDVALVTGPDGSDGPAVEISIPWQGGIALPACLHRRDDRVRIQLFPPSGGDPWDFPLDEFLAAIKMGVRRLAERPRRGGHGLDFPSHGAEPDTQA